MRLWLQGPLAALQVGGGLGEKGREEWAFPGGWDPLAREPSFPSVLGGVWLDGLWHGPLRLRECLPTHVPPPLLCPSCLSPRDCPLLLLQSDFLPSLPQSSLTSFLSLLICLPPLCFLASPLHMPFSLPGMSPPPPILFHISGLLQNPVQHSLASFQPHWLRSFPFAMYPFILGVTGSENCFRPRKIQ